VFRVRCRAPQRLPGAGAARRGALRAARAKLPPPQAALLHGEQCLGRGVAPERPGVWREAGQGRTSRPVASAGGPAATGASGRPAGCPNPSAPAVPCPRPPSPGRRPGSARTSARRRCAPAAPARRAAQRRGAPATWSRRTARLRGREERAGGGSGAAGGGWARGRVAARGRARRGQQELRGGGGGGGRRQQSLRPPPPPGRTTCRVSDCREGPRAS
jgi:hypothetical protein